MLNIGIYSRNFLLRTISSIILITLALLLNNLGGYFFLFSIILLLFIVLKEYYQLFVIKVVSFKYFINFFLILISLLIIFFKFYLLILFLLLLGLLITIILEKKKWIAAAFTYIYLGIPLYILLYLNNSATDGKIIITWLFVIVWSSDISAYIFGKLIKGPKLVPKLSPNKTWFGFFASLIFSVIASISFVSYYNIFSFKKALYFGAIVGLFCASGDLFESWLKRYNSKKDTSNLIPGHGGLLDRLDGFLFAIVAIYLLLFFWS